MIVFLLIFQLILSGCSPDGSFQASKSTEIIVTDPYITPDRTVVINPRPSKSVPKPSPHVLGALQISKASLQRAKDRSLLFTATATIKDSQHRVLWTRPIELEGYLDVDNNAKLYPVQGDAAGDYAVRARLLCMDSTTCDEAIIDIFVNDLNKKTHAAQIYALMEVIEEAPVQNDIQKSVPTLQAPKTGSAPSIPKAESPAPKSTPSPAKPTAPKADLAPHKPSTPSRVTGKDTTSSPPPSVMSESPAPIKAPVLKDEAPKITTAPDSKPKISAAPESPKIEAMSKPRPGFLSRLFFGEPSIDTPPEYDHTTPPPPNANKDEPSFFASLWPFGKKDETPNVAKNPEPIKAEPSAKPKPTEATKPVEKKEDSDLAKKIEADMKPEVTPSVTDSIRPRPRPEALDTSLTEDEDDNQEEEEDLDHGDEEDPSDEHGETEEERKSLYIGTLHVPSEELFETDRATRPDSSVRPRPRPAPSTDGMDDISRGSRPKDQVIGRTACETRSGKSCGFLERASDLTKFEQSGNFKVGNKERARYFGSYELVYLIDYIGKYYTKNPSFGTLSVNDLSLRGGGKVPNSSHNSHQNGLDADISYPFSTTAFRSYVSRGAATSSFKARETWAIFKALWATKYVDRIFVNPAIKVALCQEATRAGELNSYQELLRRIRPTAGHDKHFHLRIRCSDEQPRCYQMGPPAAGSGCR